MDLKTRNALFEKAFDFQANGQYDRAVEELNKLLHIDPDFVEAHCLLGNIYNLTGETDKAVLCYRNGLKIDPTCSKAKYMLDLLMDEGKKGTSDIIEEREKYKEAEIYFSKGLESFSAKDFEKAIEFFKKAVEVSPEYHQAYYNLGVVYYHNGDREKAEGFWKKTLDYDARNPKVFFSLGVLSYKAGKLDEAISFWENVVADDVHLPQVYCNLGVAYYERGDKRKALKYLRKAISFEPDYKLARENIEQVEQTP